MQFRELTKKVIAAEKFGFWSDWTAEQQDLYENSDWETFSRSRGYSEQEISDFKQWLNMIDTEGIYLLASVSDLITEAAINNVRKDKNNEIHLSSHFPKREVELCHGQL